MTNIITENLTEPSRENPIQGDKIKFTNTETGSIIIKHYNEPYIETQEEIDNLAKDWRNQELSKTDHIVPLTDHPDHAATLAYRVALRDWPTTSDFPETKPTL